MQVAVLGCGVVGRGTVEFLMTNAERITARTGCPITVKYILERRELEDFPYADKIVRDFEVIVNDPEVDVVIEAMGGSHPAEEFSLRALKAGKHVVTSNKEVVANFGVSLLEAAAENGVQYLFEASVGGGIPVLRPLGEDLAGNEIDSIAGILNGTTNFILTAMFEEGKPFEEALADAKLRGYAEQNPAADIEGLDACRKIAILTAVATGKLVRVDSIHTEGITKIRAEDVAAAEGLGYAIKLLGRMLRTSLGDLFLMVAPFLVPVSSPLYPISGVFNGVLVHGNFVDDVLFFGRGAGAEPTASAMVADVLHLAMRGAPSLPVRWTAATEGDVTDFSHFTCRRYVSLSGVDRNAAEIFFGDAEFLPEENGLALLTAELSEREFENKLERIRATGGELLSHIRVL